LAKKRVDSSVQVMVGDQEELLCGHLSHSSLKKGRYRELRNRCGRSSTKWEWMLRKPVNLHTITIHLNYLMS